MLAFRWTRSEFTAADEVCLGNNNKKERLRKRNQQISISVSLVGQMALCGNGSFPPSSSNPDQQTVSVLRGEKNDLTPQPGTRFAFFLSHTTQLKESWKEGMKKERGQGVRWWWLGCTEE